MSDMRLTVEELDQLPQKTKKHEHIVELYLQHDFLTAYAKHTADRMHTNGYRGAIGPEDRWDELGEKHAQWLIDAGVKSTDTFLDFGCGTGRLARKLAPHVGHYFGVDLCAEAVEYAELLSAAEGWSATLSADFPSDQRFDVVWAYSVFIHNPYVVMVDSMRKIRSVMKPDARFFFSWTNEPKDIRTGLKQFRHTLATYIRACEEAGLELSLNLPVEWKHDQRIAVARVQQ